MKYREHTVPTRLTGWVAGLWTLQATGDEWIEHEATPDGCIEVIRRHSGRSIWGTEQPPRFATGLTERSVAFSFSPGTRFSGIRLWPWAWHALSDRPCRELAGRWIALEPCSRIGALLDGDSATALAAALPDPPPAIARTVQNAVSVGDIVAETGLSHRQVQRWFAATVGISPRRYLRLLRFRAAMRALPQSEPLAGTAADAGYADQPHMTRDFRSLSGITPASAKRRATGPFL
ncbi:AraC family transcriptional regulator [Sphingomonas sp.]|uniref:AraC family transcriptional regulator n=1 Tax=Sphingomonas sp. TaxID=28214 RepID=UPI002DD6B984|nr:helix-turn-helix domain-containing protein [Sphingomonas sp.]